MKKISKIFALVIILFSLSACFQDDKLSNDNVYTTIYPIQYITNYLYGSEKKVNSIYPNGADVSNYRLTDKQKETYQKGGLFVYNGLTSEEELALEFLNNNRNILLIDVAHGLSYENAIEELWLSPNNYLMLTKNVKNNLINYTTSKIVVENIETKYHELEEKLSYMDADLRTIASEAKKEGNATLIVSSAKLAFLKKYKFDVIVLDSDILNEDVLVNNFKNNTYKDIYVCDTDEKTPLIVSLEKAGANIINVETLYTLTDEEQKDGEDYLTIMEAFIENIRNTTLG